MGTEHRTTPWLCPCCGTILDAAEYVGGRAVNGYGEEHADQCGPEVGSYTICLYCANILQFEEGLALREVKEEDLIDASREFLQTLLDVQKVVKRMKVERPVGQKPGNMN